MASKTNLTVAFPPLPVDIFREIVEFASYSSRSSALALTLVSSFTRAWSIPALYETVLLRSVTTIKRFRSTLESSPPPNSRLAVRIPIARRVKNLAIMAASSVNAMHDIVARCCELKSFACGTPLYQNFPVNSPSIQSTERHFLGASCRDGIPFFSLSPQVTHLHLQLASCQALSSLFELYDYTPKLTHLAISLPSKLLAEFHSLRSIVDHTLQHNRHLELILVQTTDLSNEDFHLWAKGLESDLDVRVVVRKAPKSIVEQWRAANAGAFPKGIWNEAAEVVRRRQETAIQKTCNI
ncbi:hypothetical protein VNI00_003963 [Paramarasmius palmivorus]|uniref:F-box domain-containing protein n=1 Tax=Paramarasmius palmivorus TaxID=297713 RepID=A0AAW0DKS0_9AGAR